MWVLYVLCQHKYLYKLPNCCHYCKTVISHKWFELVDSSLSDDTLRFNEHPLKEKIYLFKISLISRLC